MPLLYLPRSRTAGLIKMHALPLILASSSRYRKQLLERISNTFSCVSPDIDESICTDESAANLVERLAKKKAYKIAEKNPAALIIGSDQVALLTTSKQILNKPKNLEKALLQLQEMSGQEVQFLTGLAVLNSKSGAMQYCCEVTKVYFRELDKAEIKRYLLQEKPFDCAGSFKAEQLGITLTEKISSDDPTALIGLPLIPLAKMLRNEQFTLVR